MTNSWPELSDLRPTMETLQLWTQIVGKVRLAQTPWLNHSWHTPLYVTAPRKYSLLYVAARGSGAFGRSKALLCR